MLADGADCGSLLADVDVSAVAAFPHGDLVLLEDHTGLDVLQEVEVPLLVGLLDSADGLEESGDLGESLLPGGLGELLVHGGVLVVLSGGGVLQVLDGLGNLVVVEGLEPQLGVLLLVLGGLEEDVGDLLVSLFLGLGGVVGVLVPGHGLASEGGLQVCFCFGSFEFHDATSGEHYAEKVFNDIQRRYIYVWMLIKFIY